MRRLARVRYLLLLWVFLLITGGWAGVSASADPTDDDATATGLSIVITGQTPAVMTGPTEMTLQVEVSNHTDQNLGDLIAEVRLQNRTPPTRERVEEWLDSHDHTSTIPLHSQSIPAIPPGQTRLATLTIPQESWPRMGRGPRGLLVHIVPAQEPGEQTDDSATPPPTPTPGASSDDGAGGGHLEAVARSFVVVWPETNFPPIGLNILLPLTASSSEIASAPQEVNESKRMRALADLAGPGVTLITDPLINTDLASAPHATFPTGDPDITALTATDAGRTYLTESLPVEQKIPLIWWPQEFTEAVHDYQPPGSVAVITDTAATKSDDVFYTPSALTRLGESSVVVVDSVLTKHLNATADPVTHRQALLAHLAAAVRELPNDKRVLVAAVDRGADPAASALAEKIEALRTAPLVSAQALPLDDSASATLPKKAARWQVSPAANVNSALGTQVREALTPAARISHLTADPNAVVGDLSIIAQRARSSVLASAPQVRNQVLGQVRERSEALAHAVRVTPPSSLLLISGQPDIPIAVENSLPQDVDVSVDFVAADPRLQTRGPVHVTLPAQQRTTVSIPVNAVGSGDLRVRVRVMGSDGAEVTSSEPFGVRVRADWESTGTAVAGGVLALLTVGGIIRTVRRHRRAGMERRGRISLKQGVGLPAGPTTLLGEETNER